MVGEGEEEQRKTMMPWEQHSAVISMPRYDYRAPSSLLQRSHSGFLITCTLKREKSATKEAISILEKYISSSSNCCSESLGVCDASAVSKRRKMYAAEIDGGHSKGAEGSITATNSRDSVEHRELTKGEESSSAPANSVDTDLVTADELPKEVGLHDAKPDVTADKGFGLSLVKLTRSGLVLFTFPGHNDSDTAHIVSNIMESQQSGTLKSLLWCHRIFPIQATCLLKEKELRTTVAQLVAHFVNDARNKLGHPVKFAVGFNRRGIEETETKNSKNRPAEESTSFPVLDRTKCFAIVGAAVKNVVPDSVVDLKAPELSVLVELLPLSGVPSESLVVAVSVLPHNLVSTKPRLCIKALLSNVKAKQ